MWKNCKNIDFAVPGVSMKEKQGQWDRGEGEREDKKVQRLINGVTETQNVRVNIIPLAMASSGAIPKQFGNRLKEAGVIAEIGHVQKTALLGTARILRKVFEI